MTNSSAMLAQVSLKKLALVFSPLTCLAPSLGPLACLAAVLDVLACLAGHLASCSAWPLSLINLT